MENRFQNSPAETATLTTSQLRSHFLIQRLMRPDEQTLVYSHYDRMIIGGINPVHDVIVLLNPAELRATYFTERREIGIINLGGEGTVSTQEQVFTSRKLDCVYIGKETPGISFKSTSTKEPAFFYLLSCPAHKKYPNRRLTREEAAPVELGDVNTSNQRTIYKYIHDGGIESCQLVMGLTVLKPGSVWNSVPPHTHTRRMEVYFYFDVPPSHTVFHFMGEPQQTRHIVALNHEAVISPPWSMHFGCGTSSYGFVWGMAGENKQFTDMDPVTLTEIR